MLPVVFFWLQLGIYFLFFKKVKVNEEGKQVFSFAKEIMPKSFCPGYFMNTLNPAVFIFWITTTATTINHTVQHRIMIFATCLAWVLGTDILKVMLAGKIRNRLTPHNIHILNRINGIILIVFGFALIWGLLSMGKDYRKMGKRSAERGNQPDGQNQDLENGVKRVAVDYFLACTCFILSC